MALTLDDLAEEAAGKRSGMRFLKWFRDVRRWSHLALVAIVVLEELKSVEN